MGIRKEPATVTRRLSESLDFALMPLGFKNQRLLAREWPLYPCRRFDTLHRPDNCAAGLAGWQLRCPVPLFTWSPGLCTDQCWKGRPIVTTRAFQAPQRQGRHLLFEPHLCPG